MKIVRSHIIEGVADTASHNMFNTDKPHSKFEDDYNSNQEEKVAHVHSLKRSTVIIKNPKNVDIISPSSRGLIDLDGNLYIELKPTANHEKIIKALILHKVLPDKLVDWWYTDIEKVGYITVQKDNYPTNNIYVGESNILIKRPNESHYDKFFSKRHKYLPIFQKYLNKAQHKNPEFNFICEIIEN